MGDVQLVQYNSTTLQLTYTPPFTLIGVPIYFFSITITSSDQSTNITINTTATELLYSPPNICTDYLLDIAAWNRLGRGETYFLFNWTLYRGENNSAIILYFDILIIITAPQEVIVHSTLAFTATPISVAKFDVSACVPHGQ